MGAEKFRVLIIHALRPTSRQTTIDHLLAFRKHLPNADVQYLHFAQPLPKEIAAGIEPDLLIVNYDYLNYRFTPLWPYIRNRHRDIARRSKKVVAIAQDDFWAHRHLDNWCTSWCVNRVLTPIDNNLEALYPKTIRRAEFRTVLTGYAPTPAGSVPPLRNRPIDLGQRVRETPPNLGAYAQEKSRQAVRFAGASRGAGFVVDVSTKVEDSLLGHQWPEFLRSCKFTVGMKGGASIADPYGILYSRVQAQRLRNPDRQLRTESFPFLARRDGRHQFSAISPRLFESAAAGTCQVLRKDDYLGVLQPWVHYIPLEANMSNITEVHSVMRDLDRCQEIANTCRETLIESGRFGYQLLVDAASDGLLTTSSNDDRGGWRELSEWLQMSALLSRPQTQELHDAAFHLMYEELGNLERGVASSTIKQHLSAPLAVKWFEMLMNESQIDNTFVRRLPWTPRLIG